MTKKRKNKTQTPKNQLIGTKESESMNREALNLVRKILWKTLYKKKDLEMKNKSKGLKGSNSMEDNYKEQ